MGSFGVSRMKLTKSQAAKELAMKLTKSQAAKELAELVIQAYSDSPGSAFPSIEKIAVRLAKQVVPGFKL
jgi:hypothetical protein